MMTGPRLLLLDEPTAGLHPSLIGGFMKRLLDFASRGCGVLMASHDLDSISSTCHRLIGMHNGKVIAEGQPDEVMKSDQLIEAYIGY
jgi:ABC-type branched-subunit amino acid transport system ATPase component